MISPKVRMIAMEKECHAFTSLHTRYYLSIYIAIYIKCTVCQRCHKECPTSTCADDCYNCWKKSKLKSYVRPGFMDNTNRQAVKNWLNPQTNDASLTSWRQPFFIKLFNNYIYIYRIPDALIQSIIDMWYLCHHLKILLIRFSVNS